MIEMSVKHFSDSDADLILSIQNFPTQFNEIEKYKSKSDSQSQLLTSDSRLRLQEI